MAEKNCFINSCKTVDEERDGREEDATKFDPTPNTNEQQENSYAPVNTENISVQFTPLMIQLSSIDQQCGHWFYRCGLVGEHSPYQYIGKHATKFLECNRQQSRLFDFLYF